VSRRRERENVSHYEYTPGAFEKEDVFLSFFLSFCLRVGGKSSNYQPNFTCVENEKKNIEKQELGIHDRRAQDMA
jgi:hypothetical protein